MGYNNPVIMASTVFYRKWRPQALAEVVGQPHITGTLLNALKSGNTSHAYLFCGPRGTGKTSTGRILSKAVNCLTNKGKGDPCNKCHMCTAITEGRSLDVIEIDAASNTGVDDIRELKERINYVPAEADYKVYIIDEVHMLSNSASNALLKTLEEPPPRVIFILATTELHKVLSTVMSRCQRFDFHRVSQVDIVGKLKLICTEEGIKIEDGALKLIARSATGSLRDAENMLEQLNTYYSSDINLKQVQETLGITGDSRSKELASYIVNGDIKNGLKTAISVNQDGLDLKQFNRELTEQFRKLLLVKSGSEASVELSKDELNTVKALAKDISLEQIIRLIKIFSQLYFNSASNPSLMLETAIVEASLSPTFDTKTTAPTTTEETPSLKKKEAAKNTAKPPAVTETAPTPTEVTAPTVIKEKAAFNAGPPTATEETKPKASEQSPKPKVNKLTAEAGKELLSLQNNWTDIIEQSPPRLKRTAAVAILRSAGVKPISYEDNTVTLSFKYSLHRDKVEEADNKRIVIELLSGFLGTPCQVNCIFQPNNNHLVQEAQKMGAQIINVEE